MLKILLFKLKTLSTLKLALNLYIRVYILSCATVEQRVEFRAPTIPFDKNVGPVCQSKGF